MRNLIHELVAHYGDLRRHLTRELKDPHHAADIAQSSFERVFAQAQQQAPGGNEAMIDSPRALLFRVARNLCIDDARRKKVAQDWASHHGGAGQVPTAPSSECLAAQRQVLARVVAVLEALPPRRREVYLLFRAHGFTRSEIALRLDITEMAVAKHLVRATLDCARAFAELRQEVIEPASISRSAGFEPRLAEDFS
jgi:RNA polymerase sigma factor (sigma-70 family)